MEQLLLVDVVYTVRSGKRGEFYSRLVEHGIISASRSESGNRRYDYCAPMESENELWLTEIWTGEDALKEHAQTEHYKKHALLKNEFVEQAKIKKYLISGI